MSSYLGASSEVGSAIIGLIGKGIDTAGDIVVARSNKSVAEINKDITKMVSDTSDSKSSGMTDNTKLAIGIGGAALVGLIAIMSLK